MDVCQALINGPQSKKFKQTLLKAEYETVQNLISTCHQKKKKVNKSLAEFDLDTPFVHAGSAIDSKSADIHNTLT